MEIRLWSEQSVGIRISFNPEINAFKTPFLMGWTASFWVFEISKLVDSIIVMKNKGVLYVNLRSSILRTWWTSPGGIETQKNSSDQIIASAIRTLFVNLRIKLDNVKKTREETGIFISRFLKLKKDLGNLKKIWESSEQLENERFLKPKFWEMRKGWQQNQLSSRECFYP